MTLGLQVPVHRDDDDLDGAGGDAAGVSVVVCNSCRHPDDPDDAPRRGALLVAAAMRAAEGSAVVVKQVACLGNCSRGLTAAVLRSGCWSYVFGDLGPDNGADLIAGAKLFARSTDGFMGFRERPEPLKRGLIARVPTFEILKDLP